MRCETCDGTGIDTAAKCTWDNLICEDCGGSGIAYCCDTAGSNQPNTHSDEGGDAPANKPGSGGGGCAPLAIVLLACVLALPLAGCVTSSRVTVSGHIDSPRLPPMPGRIRGCFGQLTPIPVQNMSGSELTRVLARVRQSEARKSRCGRDVIQWYDGVRRSYGPK